MRKLKTRSTKIPIDQLLKDDDALKSFLLSGDLSSISVTEESAMTIPAFAAGIKIISQTTASLPATMYRKNESNGRDKAPDHYLYKLLKVKPNPYMTAYVFWEKILKDLMLRGNAYCLIERDRTLSNRIVALHILPALGAEMKWTGKRFEYIFKGKDKEYKYPAEQVWHIPNAGDGFKGVSLIEQYKKVLQLALIVENFTSTYFKQGVTNGTYLEFPEGTEAPNEEGKRNIKNLFKRKKKDSEDYHSPTLVPAGVTLHEFKRINLKESQLIELKTYVIQEIARIFNLPPHILNDLSKSSFNNIVEMNRNILTFALNPYLKRIENSVNAFLLESWETDIYYCEFNREALLQANPKEKAEQVKALVYSGVLNINEAKALYNLPSIGEQGDVAFMPSGLIPIETAINQNKKEEKENEETEA